MFINQLNTQEDGKKTIIGEFSKIEGEYVIIKANNSLIKVKHQGLEAYKTKNIMITGFVEDGIFIEEMTKAVEDDFNYTNYNKLVAMNSKFAGIF